MRKFIGHVVAAAISMGAMNGFAVSAQQVKSQWEPVYAEDQATRGEALYTDYCSGCHGPDLGGTILAPALAGEAFAAKWDGQSMAALFELMRSTMPLNSPGGFSAEQNADLLAYMLKKTNAPAGPSALPSAIEALQSIKFLAKNRGATGDRR